MTGFEPATSRLSAGCSSQTKLHALSRHARSKPNFKMFPEDNSLFFEIFVIQFQITGQGDQSLD